MAVALRPLTASDAEWCDAWLAPLSATLRCQDARSVADLLDWARDDRRAHAAMIEREGAPAGVCAWRAPARQRGAGVIELIALPSAGARRGDGMTAATLVERSLRDAGARRIYAPVPGSHGIAMYFWIRLGYHPLLRLDWPEERRGFGWMARDFA